MIRNFFKEEGELYLNERYAKKDNSFSKKLWYDKKRRKLLYSNTFRFERFIYHCILNFPDILHKVQIGINLIFVMLYMLKIGSSFKIEFLHYTI